MNIRWYLLILKQCQQESVILGDAPIRFWTQKSIPLVVSVLFPGQSSKWNNSKIRHDRVKFLCTVLLLNEIYLLTVFLVDTSCSFTVISWTKFTESRWKMGNYSHLARQSYFSFSLHIYAIDLSTYKVICLFIYSFGAMSRTKFKNKKK
jgi:hypothetical protein